MSCASGRDGIFPESTMRHKDVPRWDDTRSKKKISRPRVRAKGLLWANVPYWRKNLRHCWDFSAFPSDSAPGSCASLAHPRYTLVWHFAKKCAAVKFVEPWISDHFFKLRDHSYVGMAICVQNALRKAGEATLAGFFFWASCSNHCLDASDLGAGVEQPFKCLIVLNRQAVQSMGWTLKDNMVDGLFFYATLKGRRGGHAPFVQTWAETPDTGAEAVKSDPGSSWEGRSGGCRCRGRKWGVLWGCPPTLHSIGDPPTAPHVRQMNRWVAVRQAQMGVSIWGAVHLH